MGERVNGRADAYWVEDDPGSLRFTARDSFSREVEGDLADFGCRTRNEVSLNRGRNADTLILTDFFSQRCMEIVTDGGGWAAGDGIDWTCRP